jgi:two-component system response regulator MprA
MSTARVLIVEDDPDLRRLLRQGLEEEGYGVEAARGGADALERAELHPPDLLVVDIGLPDTDGRDLAQALRTRGLTAPLLFLTARDAPADRISGFTAGGDDYVTKPFEFAELVARLGALSRRSRSSPAVVGDLRLDPMAHEAQAGTKCVALTPTEFRLLGAMTCRPAEVVRRRELVATAWPDGAIVHDNTLDVYIARLRRKMGSLPTEVSIETVHGVGYKLQ